MLECDDSDLAGAFSTMGDNMMFRKGGSAHYQVLMGLLLLGGCGTKGDGLPSGVTRINNEAEARACQSDPDLVEIGLDNDLDGARGGILFCAQANVIVPGLSTSAAIDCDDKNAGIFPTAIEFCNGVDDDCDGIKDDSCVASLTSCYVDQDGDGVRTTSGQIASADADCGDKGEAVATTPSGDCDDANVNVRPGAVEACNTLDDNCDQLVDNGGFSYLDYYQDVDMDTFGDPMVSKVTSCAPISGRVTNKLDCNDTTSAVKPGGVEVCDGLDNDCKNGLDDGLTCSGMWFTDADKDGTGNPATGHTTQATGDVSNGFDCDDSTKLRSPNNVEVQGDNLDNDCNATTPDNPNLFCRDSDLDLHGDEQFGTSTTAQPGFVGTCDDCDDNDPRRTPGNVEAVGNGIDDDCNGLTSDVLTGNKYADADGDGYGNKAVIVTVGGTPDNTDCNDADKAAHPGAPEIVGDQLDEDCSGFEVCYRDNDDDGTRSSTNPLVTYNSNDLDCLDQYEAIASDLTSDCDDNNPNIHTGVAETPGDEIDYNCDGQELCYVDFDGDDFRPTVAMTIPSSDTTCQGALEGTASQPMTDCDDSLAGKNIHPGVVEITADGIDQDCDGKDVCYLDVDADGYRKDTTSTYPVPNDMDCLDSQEAVATTVDCNDQLTATHPNAVELCNGIDDNCDGKVDENANGAWYEDKDGDKYGNPLVTSTACVAPIGFVTDKTDCQDGDANVNPGKAEVCDNIDQNCNGQVNDSLTCNTDPPPQGNCPAGQRKYTGTFWAADNASRVLDVYGSVTGGGVNEFTPATWTATGRFHATIVGAQTSFSDDLCVADSAVVRYSVHYLDRNGAERWSAMGGSLTGTLLVVSNGSSVITTRVVRNVQNTGDDASWPLP